MSNHKRRPVIPWPEIKAAFVRGMSVSQCAERFGVSPFTISSRSKREKWGSLRAPNFQRPVREQASEIDSDLIDAATKTIAVNLNKAADDTLSDLERRRAAMIANAAAQTLRNLTIAKEKQQRMARSAAAEAEIETRPATITLNLANIPIPPLTPFEDDHAPQSAL